MIPSFDVVLCNKTMVLLVDLNEGPTITNAANKVVRMLNAQLDGGIGGRRIVYRDTDGRFDEILHSKGRAKKFKALSNESQQFFARVMDRRSGPISLKRNGNSA